MGHRHEVRRRILGIELQLNAGADVIDSSYSECKKFIHNNTIFILTHIVG